MSPRDPEDFEMSDDHMFVASWNIGGHPSEETIHAWIDRALSDADAVSVDAHVMGCAKCSAKVAEVRGVIAASTMVVRSLDVFQRSAGSQPVARGRVTPKTADDTVSIELVRSATSRLPSGTNGITRRIASIAAVLVVAVSGATVWQQWRGGTVSAIAAAEQANVKTDTIPRPVAPIAADEKSKDQSSRSKAPTSVEKSSVGSAAPTVKSTASTKSIASASPPAKSAPVALIRDSSIAQIARQGRATGYDRQRIRVDGAAAVVESVAPATANTDSSVTVPFRGRVVSAETGRPIEGVQVTIRGTTLGTVTNAFGEFALNATSLVAKTDTSGVFELKGRPRDSVSVLIRRIGYVGTNARVALPMASNGMPVEFSMQPSGAAIAAVNIKAEQAPLTNALELPPALCLRPMAFRNPDSLSRSARLRSDTPVEYELLVGIFSNTSQVVRIALASERDGSLAGATESRDPRFEVTLRKAGLNWTGALRKEMNGVSTTDSIAVVADTTARCSAR